MGLARVARSDPVLAHQTMIPHEDVRTLDRGRDPLSRGVRKALRLHRNDPVRARVGHERAPKRMLRPQLRRCGGAQQLVRRSLPRGHHLLHLGPTKSERSRLVQDDGIDPPEDLEEKPTFDNCPEPCGTTDRSKHRERRSCRDAAGARNDHDGDGRTCVARHGEGERRCGEGKVDEVAGQLVREALNRRA